MTSLVTTDLHLNHLPRDQYRHVFMVKTLPALIKKYRALELVLLGDLTDEKDRHSAPLVNAIVEHLHNLTRLCQIIINRGNHDYLDEDNPFFKFLHHMPGITWINAPTYRNGTLFLPHTHDYATAWDGLKLKPIVYAHNTFEGARGAQGHALAGIPIDLFKSVAVYSGDVHVPQELGPITYVGAPYRIDFGDDYEPRVLIKDRVEFKSVPVPGAQKRLLECRAGDILPHKINTDDIYKIRVRIKPEQVAQWPELRDLVYAWGQKHNVIIDSVKPIIVGLVGERAEAHRPKSDAELLTEYAKRFQVDATTLKVGLRLIDESES